MLNRLEIRQMGLRPYEPVYQAMGAFTDAREPGTADEIWVLEHEPVYTLGLGGKMEHVLDPGAIPVVRTDRGGQVTYHGPGQLIIYVLLDLNRRNLRVRALVSSLEQAVINCLARDGIDAARVSGAPGVYVAGRKLAALGLRVRKGRSYHGLAVNVDGDLTPFAGINPCGYAGLPVTRLSDLGVNMNCQEFSAGLLPELCGLLDQESRIPQQLRAQQRRVTHLRPELIHD
ncbi:MAG: octanoyltransferase [Gammaproteobacteria bacterium RIFCSPLOWO2_02_FULL_61_13]|nr:MAG: octanoyltransferase [Gammaproteobacteria bacterium RIFCSPLOWO2_02_FULL_61_13]